MRFLDGVLALLVIGSIALSAALWWQQPQFTVIRPEVDTVATPLATSPPPALMQPSLLLHFPDDRHTGISPGQPGYDYTWRGVTSALRSLRFERLADAVDPLPGELANRRQEYAVEFTLSGTLTLGDWLASWGLPGPLDEGEGPAVTRILLSLAEPAAAIVWTADGPKVLRSVTSAQLRDVLKTMGIITHDRAWRQLPELIDGVRIAEDIYVPTVKQLPVYALSSNLAERQPGVAESFFLDLSVVRTITEHDNAVLFTDGQAGLRLYPSGAVEYQRARAQAQLQELPPALLSSVERAYAYSRARDRWPREAYLASSSRAAGYRSLRFGQRLGGWPVFAETPALEVAFDSSGVVRYARNAFPARVTGEMTPIVRPETAISAIADQIGWRHVTAVELGYARPDPATTDTYLPVWRLTVTGGMQHLVDATTGMLLGGEAP